MEFFLPKDVNFIIGKLMDYGHEAYAVGGCVRDLLLKKEPHDWDITTSALPEQVKEIFGHTVDTGIQHGTVTVMINHVGYEVTTYRVDGAYADGRHPDEVFFTSLLSEDLRRRDFTINAMAYNEQTGVVDLFGGQEDLESHIIRAVGNPKERFMEDSLRMLRAMRFSAQLGFDIEPDTYKAIAELSDTMKRVSAERIATELIKLITSPNPNRIKMCYETGLTKVFLPEFDALMDCEQNNPYHCYTVGEHTIKGMESIEPDRILRLTMLLHDIAKPACKTTTDGRDHFKGHPLKGSEMAVAILKRLKLDNDTIARVKKLVLYHDERPVTKAGCRRLAVKVGRENMDAIIKIRYADCMAQSPEKREETLLAIENEKHFFEEIVKDEECIRIADMKINGADLLELGVPQGKEIGRILGLLFNEIVEQPDLNDRDILLDKVRKYL